MAPAHCELIVFKYLLFSTDKLVHKLNICESYVSLSNDLEDNGDSDFGIQNDLDYFSGSGFGFCYINIFSRQGFLGEPLDFEYSRPEKRKFYPVQKLKSLRTAGNNCCFHIK